MYNIKIYKYMHAETIMNYKEYKMLLISVGYFRINVTNKYHRRILSKYAKKFYDFSYQFLHKNSFLSN